MDLAGQRDRSDRSGEGAWPARAAWLALAGAVIGMAYSLLLRGGEGRGWTDDSVRLFVATFLVVGGIAFAFTIDRVRATWSAAFALGAGLLVALVSFWNGPWSGWNSDEPWRFGCALLTVAIAAPFLQVSRDRGRWSTDYADLHGHAWTNIVVWFASLAFALLAFLLANLLGELFTLIGIDLLRDLLRKDWFNWAIAGGAFGAAVGLLRDNDRIVRLLQRVVVTVLSVLAPVLAVGLVLFLVALPFTGLTPLWDSTRATTPILLACVIGALILGNGIIGNGADEEARSPILRWSGLALAASVLPLALIAAISTGSRVAQHGMSPDRLWAIAFVAVFVAYGAAYLLAVARRRTRWADAVRPANVQLALGLLILAGMLATPLLEFDEVATRNQVARLESGKVKVSKFDWEALRFDFGPAGVRALDRLSREGRAPAIRQLAAKARARTGRFDDWLETKLKPKEIEAAARSVQVWPRQVPVPQDLRDALFASGKVRHLDCGPQGGCRLFWQPGEDAAVFVVDGCAAFSPAEQVEPGQGCRIDVNAYVLEAGRWQDASRIVPAREVKMSRAEESASLARERGALDRGDVEVRSVQHRQVFLGGKPVGEPFE